MLAILVTCNAACLRVHVVLGLATVWSVAAQAEEAVHGHEGEPLDVMGKPVPSYQDTDGFPTLAPEVCPDDGNHLATW
jgi:hypothetical protein